jgi:hypothetical protein
MIMPPVGTPIKGGVADHGNQLERKSNTGY